MKLLFDRVSGSVRIVHEIRPSAMEVILGGDVTVVDLVSMTAFNKAQGCWEPLRASDDPNQGWLPVYVKENGELEIGS